MMLFEIKSRWTGNALFSLETDLLKLCVEAAVTSGADLSGANLSGSDLSGADLSGANLSGSNLSRANLSGSNLSRANLSRSNLSRADLSEADLSGSDLSRADLSRADLSGSDLSGADLNKFITSDLYGMLDQPGKIRAYKLVTKDGVGPFNGGITYEIGKTYSVKDANTDENKRCGAGINVASLPWVLIHHQPGYRILIAEFTAKDIACIPLGTDGKFRVHRCKIVGEKTLESVGLK